MSYLSEKAGNNYFTLCSMIVMFFIKFIAKKYESRYPIFKNFEFVAMVFRLFLAIVLENFAYKIQYFTHNGLLFLVSLFLSWRYWLFVSSTSKLWRNFTKNAPNPVLVQLRRTSNWKSPQSASILRRKPNVTMIQNGTKRTELTMNRTIKDYRMFGGSLQRKVFWKVNSIGGIFERSESNVYLQVRKDLYF